MKGSGVGSAWCVVHAVAWRVSCVVGGHNVVTTEHGR